MLMYLAGAESSILGTDGKGGGMLLRHLKLITGMF